MKQLFRTVLFYNDLFLILKSSLLSWVHRRQRWLLAGLLGLVLAAGFVLWRRKKNAGPPIGRGQAGALPAHWEHVDRFEGLTDAEAAERTEPFDLDEITSQEERQFLVRAIRHNLFTVFNIDIFAIALVMFFLGNVWSTISILGVFVVNLTLNVYQMLFTKKRLDRLLRPLRPQAAVIRSRQVKSIDPADILAGDLLVVGSGDQFLVDGVLLSEQPALIEQVDQNDQARQFQVHSGESIRAGSYCLSGNVVYRASEAGRARYLVAPGSNLNLFLGEKTDLQRLIDAILTGLFGLVLVISVLLAINSFMLSNQFLTVEYTNAFSIILGIAPTSLFFILIMQYAFGTFRISERGALVYKAQTIEALSNVSVLCVSKSSLMRGVQVTVEPIAPPDGVRPLSEPVIRRYLGDFLHSLPIYSTTDRLLWDALPGSARRPVEVAAHLSDLGWLGMSFDETDMRGVLVVGLPEALQPNLARPKTPVLREVEQSLVTAQAGLGKLWGRVARRIRRRPEQTEGGEPAQEQDEAQIVTPGNDEPGAEQGDKPTLIKRLASGFKKLQTPLEERNKLQALEPEAPPQTTWLCAYLPEPVSFTGRNRRPRLPDQLIPLAYLHIENTVRPEAQRTIQEFRDAGLKVKILTENSVGSLQELARELNWESTRLAGISGSELESLPPDAWGAAVREHNVFGGLSPAQKAVVVRTLRSEGEFVAMVGDRVSDVQALRAANLRVALRNSAQAALTLTDIVLVEDSLEALPEVLVAGQRMVNGILDTFKLHLSQVGSQLLLIIGLLTFQLEHFPYHSSQGSIIAAFTITIPNIFLAAWSAASRLSGKDMRRQLLRFVIPVSVLIAVLVTGVYTFFIDRTPAGSFPPQLLQRLNVRNAPLFYAQMAVTWTLLATGWLRVLFLQPPTPFWVGGAKLRADARVFGVLAFVITLLGILLIFPFLPFQVWLRLSWLPGGLVDYLILGAAALLWAILVRFVWRQIWPASLSRLNLRGLRRLSRTGASQA